MRNRINLILLMLLGISIAFTVGCSKEKKPLVIYAGKGLKNAVEEIRLSFEAKHQIPLSIIYAGSNTLLTTIEKSKKGDIFIPGSKIYLKKLAQQVTGSHQVAFHIPAFAVRGDNNIHLRTFADIMQPGVKIAVGNKNMCAIGRVAESIITVSDQQKQFRSNIVIAGSTVNELLNLVLNREVDAALVWEDMLQWPEAKGLQLVNIPDEINSPKEIWVATLASSSTPDQADLFADFVASQGKEIFAKHGFRVE